MNEKKSKRSELRERALPPLIPPELVEKIDKEVDAAFGFTKEGDYTVSLEFGHEESGDFRKALDYIRDNDSRQKITRRGRECYYVTYNVAQLSEMFNLYDIILNLGYNEVYINHRRLPYARSLWLPLFRMAVGK